MWKLLMVLAVASNAAAYEGGDQRRSAITLIPVMAIGCEDCPEVSESTVSSVKAADVETVASVSPEEYSDLAWALLGLGIYAGVKGRRHLALGPLALAAAGCGGSAGAAGPSALEPSPAATTAPAG